MEKAKVKAFQVTEDHFRGATPVPEWMEGRARLLDFDGISGKIEITKHGSYWLVRPGEWFVFLEPGFIVAGARVFHEYYEPIE